VIKAHGTDGSWSHENVVVTGYGRCTSKKIPRIVFIGSGRHVSCLEHV
jgi:hypothetical protein